MRLAHMGMFESVAHKSSLDVDNIHRIQTVEKPISYNSAFLVSFIPIHYADDVWFSDYSWCSGRTWNSSTHSILAGYKEYK